MITLNRRLDVSRHVLKADPEFIEIHRIADKLEPKLKREFLKVFEQMGKSMPVNRITELIESESFLELSKLISKLQVPNPAAIEALLVEGATSSGTVTAAGLDMSFVIKNPAVEAWAERYAGQLITQVTKETQKAVGNIVATGFREGVAPRTSARQIRRVVGLTDRQAGQVSRFLQGQLDAGVSLKQAEKRADAMRRRLINRRANVIARNESITSANKGQYQAWLDAADAGLIDPVTTRRIWIAAPDDRLCPICAVLDGDTVEFTGSFTSNVQASGLKQSGSGLSSKVEVLGLKPLKNAVNAQFPPAHVLCRCTTGLVFDENAPRTSPIQPSGTPGWSPMMSEEDAKAFTKNSKVKGDVFHGTDIGGAKGITSDGFSTDNVAQGHWFGKGSYFTPDEEAAARWARVNNDTAARTITSKVNIENPYIVEDWPALPPQVDNHIKWGRPTQGEFSTIAGDPYYFNQSVEDWLLANPDIDDLMQAAQLREAATPIGAHRSQQFGEQFTEELKSRGHDGVLVRSTDPDSYLGRAIVGGEEVLVFDAKQIATYNVGETL